MIAWLLSKLFRPSPPQSVTAYLVDGEVHVEFRNLIAPIHFVRPDGTVKSAIHNGDTLVLRVDHNDRNAIGS